MWGTSGRFIALPLEGARLLRHSEATGIREWRGGQEGLLALLTAWLGMATAPALHRGPAAGCVCSVCLLSLFSILRANALTPSGGYAASPTALCKWRAERSDAAVCTKGNASASLWKMESSSFWG